MGLCCDGPKDIQGQQMFCVRKKDHSGPHMYNILGLESLILEWMSWFDEAMPEITPLGLERKIVEEHNEFHDAATNEEAGTEAVDTLITLWRWCCVVLGPRYVEQQLLKKLNINKGRTFVKMPNGTYHHV